MSGPGGDAVTPEEKPAIVAERGSRDDLPEAATGATRRDRTAGLIYATPAEAGFAPDLATRLRHAIASGEAPGLHGLVVTRYGRLVFEQYGEGLDDAWGDPLGYLHFTRDTLHDLRSITKSVVSLLYGIALDAGLVPGPAEPLLRSFPEHADLAKDPRRLALTVEHALTMTLGLAWHEDLPYTDSANSEIAMERAPDRVRFVLEQPIVEAPGTSWRYSGGATALIAELIARGSGKPLPQFALERLFDPLGLGPFAWARGRDGIASAASGLRLTPRALARIGQLIVMGGQWEERRVVSRAWLRASFLPRVPCGHGVEYGYQWRIRTLDRLGPFAGPVRLVAAMGNGDQALFVLPSLEIVVAMTAGNYDQPNQGVLPARILGEIILPAIEG